MTPHILHSKSEKVKVKTAEEFLFDIRKKVQF